MNFFFIQNNADTRVYEEPIIYENPAENCIWLIPLGGLGEIGKNMIVLESRDNIIIIDAGIMFPREDMPGVDYVIPDIRYLIHKKDKIRGILLTHGHEDHIGAIPYILSKFEAPIFGTRLTLELMQCKLREFELPSTSLSEVKPGDLITLGDFTIQFFPVVHSISDSLGLLLRTPAGAIFHSGDFKLEPDAFCNGNYDSALIRSLKDLKIRLLLSDSTYADRPGFSVPEREVGKALDSVFGDCRGRIIISTFASSIPRIKQIVETGIKYGRKLCIHGKGLETTLTIAQELGYFHVPSSMQVRRDEVNSIKESELLILATGSQGEPLSALTLMATNNHKYVKIKEGDTVIISATPVPGNETLVHNTINSLFRLGANVIYDLPIKPGGGKDFHIHVSGHGSSEELKMLINCVEPEFFMPIHGEVRHLVHHTRLAKEVGMASERILKIFDGDILELSAQGARIVGRLYLEEIMVDGLGIGDVGPSVLRDRLAMAQNGICFVVLTVDGVTGELITGPHIETRGLIYAPESRELLEEAVIAAARSIPAKCLNTEALAGCIKSALKRYFQNRIKRRPLIVPMVIQI